MSSILLGILLFSLGMIAGFFLVAILAANGVDEKEECL